MFKKYLFVAALFTASFALTNVAAAAPSIETETVIGGGGPVGLAFAHLRHAPTTLEVTPRLAQTFRLSSRTPLGLDITFVVPAGVGANVLFDVYRDGIFRLHLGDPGLFRNLLTPVSVTRIKRNWDFTFGAGMDFKVDDKMRIGLDYRVFMPDPIATAVRYADFSRGIFMEALEGGQTWLSFTRIW